MLIEDFYHYHLSWTDTRKLEVYEPNCFFPLKGLMFLPAVIMLEHLFKMFLPLSILTEGEKGISTVLGMILKFCLFY